MNQQQTHNSLEQWIAPGRLDRDLRNDSAIRFGTLLGLPMLAAVLTHQLLSPDQVMLSFLLVLSGVWMTISVLNAQVWRTAMQLQTLLAAGHDNAVSQIIEGLKRKPLHRAVRLMLYQRLAIVLHEQGRFYEVIAVCQQVVTQHMGSAEQVRAHLLLLLVESRLAINDLNGAYLGLVELSKCNLRLIEKLQRLGLQTRYLVACNYDEVALYNIRQTIQMSELMPSEQCGAMHALLAISAKRAEKSKLTDWLTKRAKLLCEPTQLDALLGGSAMRIVKPPEQHGANLPNDPPALREPPHV